MTVKDICQNDYVGTSTDIVIRSDIGIVFDSVLGSLMTKPLYYFDVYRFSYNFEVDVLNIWIH